MLIVRKVAEKYLYPYMLQIKLLTEIFDLICSREDHNPKKDQTFVCDSSNPARDKNENL